MLVRTSVKRRNQAAVNPHRHSDTWEIILNLEGSGKNIVDGQEYPYYPGSIICIPPGIPHSKLPTDFVDIYMQCTHMLITERPRVIVAQDDDEGSFRTLMDLIYHLHTTKGPGGQAVLDSLCEAAQHYIAGAEPLPEESGSLTDRIVKHMLANFTDTEYRAAKAMDRLPFCQDYIRRRFREETGLTATEYLNRMRVDRAMRLLSDGSARHSVHTIAGMCGFYDSKYFARVFRQVTGVSPAEYVRCGGFVKESECSENNI